MRVKCDEEGWGTVEGKAAFIKISDYLDKKSKHDHAYHKIKEWIIDGTFPAETILVERQLCELLDLSRTPVRSALQELAKEGFVAMSPGRGVMVSRIQIEDVIEIFELRRSLDVLSLELLMKNKSSDIISRMRQSGQHESGVRAG